MQTNTIICNPPHRSRGSALLIVLAFLLLLTTLTVAFLSRATMERQMSNSSYSQNKTDLVAQGSIATIIADLQQEIVAGSNAGSPALTGGYYYPTSPLFVQPATVGFTHAIPPTVDGLENLVKVSKNNQNFWPATVNTVNYTGGSGPSRASAINTFSNPSLNNRSVTAARWNAPLLLAPTSATDYTPVGPFPIPDWIYVARDGTNPQGTTLSSSWAYLPNIPPTTTPSATAGTNPVTQRYAYAIYNEGGTLDMNVAGSPMPAVNQTTYTATQPYKNALSYADITQLPYLSLATQPVATGSSTTLNAAQQRLLNNAIVGWRNNFSGYVKTGKFPGTSTAYTFQTATSPSVLTPFDQNVVFNPAGFLSMGGQFGPSTLQFGSSLKIKNRTDTAFSTRQELIQFFTQGLGQNTTFTAPVTGVPLSTLINVLQYMGTFSRDISQPSYAPPPGRPVVLASTSGGNSAFGVDAIVNPSLLSVLVKTGGTFIRNDGTSALVNEPLIKKRFALNRLAWITWEGPSASLTTGDTNIKALIADGIPWTFLQQGTASNIKAYFGLSWDSTNHVWDYNVHNGASGSGPTGKILKLGEIAALATPHDPDFFEILKATIDVGSLGKALAYGNGAVTNPTGISSTEVPANYNYYAESSVDIHIIQIGANMIAQAQPAYYPPQIAFDDNFGPPYSPRTIVGVENLPYLTAVMNGALQVQPPNPLPRNGQPAYSGSVGSGTGGNSGYVAGDTILASGVGAWMQMPVIWNPYDPSCPPGVVGPTSFRVVADSATPDNVLSGTTYNSFFVYGNSAPSGASSPSYSYLAAPTSPGYSWYGDATYGSGIAHAFKNPSTGNGNAEVDFTVTPAATPLEICPEPMILMRPATVKDSSLSGANSIAVSVPSTHLMNTDLAVKSLVTGGGLPNYIPNAPQIPAPESPDLANQSYVGFYLGAFPLAWVPPAPATAPWSTGQSGAYMARFVAGQQGPPAGSLTSCYMTYRMQYQDPNNSNAWITYDTKYGLAYDGGQLGLGGVCPANVNNGNIADKGALLGREDWAFVTDPRTSRFGLMCSATNPNNELTSSYGGQGNPLPGPEFDNWGGCQNFAAGWLDTANGLLYTTRPDGQSGFYCKTGWPATTGGGWIGPNSGWMAYITSDKNPAVSGIAPGLLVQNNADTFFYPHVFYGDSQGALTQTPNYFADADGMVRRGMGAFVPVGTSASPEASYAPATEMPPADTTVGLPMARAFNWNTYTPASPNPTITKYTGSAYSASYPLSQAQSRPYFLHRPFYSVAELGYVFSDTPWRNLDFFTAESGNVALLDAFCVGDTNDPGELVAGKVDLNTRQAPVLAAVIADGCLDPVAPSLTGSGTVGQIDSTTAGLIAKALVTRTTDTTNVSNGTGPLQNVSDLVGKWQKNIAINDTGLITGVDQGTLAVANNFYDGKLSYAGFSGGVWDTANHKPYPDYTPGSVSTAGGVENFSTGTPQATTAPEDVYSAYMNSSTLVDMGSQVTNHNGPQETVGYIQRFREAPIRALAAAGTTRVWNLMIDVIAQTGRFPSSASSLANFNVEGERRYWVHVAIDRYTGKVLDEQIEEVKE